MCCSKKVCNGCMYLKKNLVYNGQASKFYNAICQYDKINPRYINYSITDEQDIEIPNFCKLSISVDDDSKTNRVPPVYSQPQQQQKTLSVQDKWAAIVPTVKWESIKAKNVYHIPPYFGCKERKDIEIVYVCQNYFTCKKKGGDYSTITYIYPSSLMYKVMVEKKNQSF